MSEVTGPPQFKGLEPVKRVPEINKHDQKPDDQKPAHEQKKSSVEQKDPSTNLSRDPAVSLSASVGHIKIGEDISGSILSIDADGRPVLITEEATFALTPDVGLKKGDSVTLNIITTEHNLIAELTFRNGKLEDPPVLLSLTLISVKELPHDTGTATHSDPRYIDSQTGAYIPPLTAPTISAPSPQTSLSSGIYQQSTAPEVGIVKKPVVNNPDQKNTPQQSKNSPPLKDDVVSVTKQPSDPTMIQSSSTDMTALLMAQQSSGAKPAQTQVIETAKSHQSGIEKSNLPSAESVSPKPPQAHSNVDASKEAPLISPEDGQVKEGLKSGEHISATTVSPAVSDMSKAPINHPVLPALFIPSDTAQTLLKKANISAPNPKMAVEVVLRAKQKNDPPNTIEVKILSAREGILPQASQAGKPANQQPKQSVEVMPAQNNTPSVTREPERMVHIETTGGSVEVSLPHGEPLPSNNKDITIIPTQHVQTPLPQASPSSDTIAPLGLLAKSLTKWPALQKTHQLINQEQQNTTIAPNIVQQINSALTSRTAGGGASLTNSLLFMMAALKQGDASSWLGPRIEQYLEQKGQKPLLNILKQDISRLANLINRPAGGEWHPIVLPLAADDNSPLLALLVRSEPQNQNETPQDSSGDDEDPENQENPTRFILEVHLSQIGNIQLDGLIKEKTFNLKFKSLERLDSGLKNTIREIFSTALDTSGYTGGITFFELPSFSINVSEIINSAESLPHETRNA